MVKQKGKKNYIQKNFIIRKKHYNFIKVEGGNPQKKMEKIKVIFLDIDGVLNVYSHDHDQYGSQFHKHLVENLRRVIDETGAKIVISSTWRYSGLQNMKDMWEFRNLPGEVIDITPDCNDLFNEGSFEFLDRIERGHEVEYWLDEHPEVENYVIFDDDNDFLPHQRGNFVRTANNINHPDCVDIGYGLTSECANRAIRILNGKRVESGILEN